jgi:hypothetical protein
MNVVFTINIKLNGVHGVEEMRRKGNDGTTNSVFGADGQGNP